ncbi:MAG: radical SAM protein [Clostridiales bacterium]|nr:radical SAM protein [Clostridiales bacterium]
MFDVEKKKKELFQRGIAHVTVDPGTKGVMRIHLIPPRYKLFSTKPAVVLLNGHFIVPIKQGWYILLYHFIDEANKIGKRKFSPGESETAVKNAVAATKAVFKAVSEKRLRSDLTKLLTQLKEICENVGAVDTKHLSVKAFSRFMTAPHRMDLMISPMTDADGVWNCPNMCVHCYATGQNLGYARALSTAEWLKIIDKCKAAHIPQLTFTGGEPTMRSDLAELIDYSRWFITRLNTNGVLLTPELCGRLYKASLDNVQITLYSSNKDIHNSLVGGDTFDKTVRGIRNALAAGLDVSVNTPLCKANADYVSTLEFIRSLGVVYVTCSAIIPGGLGAKAESKARALGKDALFNLLDGARGYCSQNGMDISFTSPASIGKHSFKTLGFVAPVCGACYSNMAVAPDGTVVPCQSYLSGDIKLGNMLTDEWRGIWKHRSAVAIRALRESRLKECLLASGDPKTANAGKFVKRRKAAKADGAGKSDKAAKAEKVDTGGENYSKTDKTGKGGAE